MRRVGLAVAAVLALVLASGARAACGNGVVESGEQCDDGAQNGSLNSCCETNCSFSGEYPDVIVGDITTPTRWGNAGGITAYSIGTSSCNIGSCWLKWSSGIPEHPVIGQNMFRLKDGRFEQIGQSWLKHGFLALTEHICSAACIAPPNGTHLGVNCSDPYISSLNGDQGRLGPKFEVNPSTGVYPYPFSNGTGSGPLYKRLQVHDVDLDPGLNPNALYFVEGQYVAHDDATAGAHFNNASYRRVSVGGAPTYGLTLQDATRRSQAAIQAWNEFDANVRGSVLVAGGGLVYVSMTATPLGGGVYHYEYAIQNNTSNGAIGSFSVPIPASAVITNVGFHDVDYHSGEPFDGTDWTAVVSSTSVTWSTQTYAQNQNANALRWGTLYNFRFDADAPPGSQRVLLGIFKPPGGLYSTSTLVPVACAAAETPCSGGFDEDCDGQTDCADTDCCTSPACAASDADGDHVGALCDCDPADPALWGAPGEVRDVMLAQADGVTTLSWNPPADPGATTARYDTLRSQAASDFVAATDCVESDGADTTSSDATIPTDGAVAYYLVRAENGCPQGEGTLGLSSGLISGQTQRTGRICP